MDTNHVLAILLLVVAVIGTGLAAAMSRIARDAVLFCFVAGAVLAEKCSAEFWTHYWYRGTTRGLEVSLLDALALALLIGAWFARDAARPRWYWPVGLAGLLAYFFCAGFSVLVADPKIFGLFELSKIARSILVFLAAAAIVRGPRQVAVIVAGLVCAVGWQGALSLKHRFLDGMPRVAGSLTHANSLSMYLCLTAPVLTAAVLAIDLSRWLRVAAGVALVVAAGTSLMTLSRAGIPTFAFVVAGTAFFSMSWRPSIGKLVALGAASVVALVLVAATWSSVRERYAESTLREEYLDRNAFESRGYYLRIAELILSERFFGVGLNNWSYWVSKSYGAKIGTPFEDYDNLYFTPPKEALLNIHYAAPAHSLAALTAGEMGWPGLAVFSLMWVRWLWAGAGFLRRRSFGAMRVMGVGCFFGIVGLLLQSTTEWTYRQTPILFTCHLLLGMLAALCYQRKRIEPVPLPAEEPEFIAVAEPEPLVA